MSGLHEEKHKHKKNKGTGETDQGGRRQSKKGGKLHNDRK